MTQMTRNEVIKAVASLLEDSKHWTKHVYARDLHGKEVNPTSSAAVCWCYNGAFAHVLGLEAGEAEKWMARHSIKELSYYNDIITHDEILIKLNKELESK